MIYAVIIAVIIVIGVFLYFQNNLIDVTRYVIKTDKINSRLKIVQLSDLHSRPFRKAMEKVYELQPDLIIITGDFINDKEKNKEKMFAYGKELLQIAPVAYITGNHERRLAHFNELMQELREIGFTVLLNEITQITLRDSSVVLLGLDEDQANFEDYTARKNGTFVYKDMRPYFKELEKYQGFKIVLSHYPENFEAVQENHYAQYDFDLQLSGHAHGGQFILPFFGPVFSPGQGIHPQYARGAFGDRPKLIVSRGLGNAEFPFRLFNHPEINVITVSRILK